ncbi:hypothetical protein M406DRAFT_73626 [Cryphonectria parasitica EP155]|uniref:Isotrichodermin C-15 hydroxylase n=1 Tax=Cryphonectria parasitica (strain ATCC 38755 / EP155) TaxID=660469 RepID=A0A9P5CKI2_CRYP1|nr:uncharacterized protein M406DRAFT_73626 [Cryphonectria parasitica EP155]KAF3761192.1 hypothetical protein M406DRAFT_73626 [Cryphonectria parasitica EP155]
MEAAAWSQTPRLLALLIGAFLAYRIGLAVYRVYFHPLSCFPGPKLWAASDLPVVWEDKIEGTFTKRMLKVHEEYGPIVRIGPNRIAVDGTIIWPQVFARRANQLEFTKVPESYPAQEKYVGLLPTQSRENHRRQRRLLAHAFSDAAMYEQERYIKYYVDLLVKRLRERAVAGETLDLTQWYNFTTFDIIGELAFADPFDALESGKSHPWISMISSSVRQAAAIQFLMHYPLLLPLMGFRVGLGDLMRLFRQSQQFIELSKEKTRKRLAMQDQSRRDIMAYIIDHNTDGKRMTQDEMFENSRALIGAGSETTATALSGMSFHLCQSPEAYQRLTDEIRTAFTCEEDITMRSTAHLPYLHACLEEALRMYPPASETPPRVSPGDYIHHDGNEYWIPKGTRLSNYQWATHHSPNNFADPEKYAPERWLPASHPLYNSRYAHDKKAVFRPFAAGPRDCIGKNLAYSEMRLVIARLLWNFDLELAEGQKDWVDSQLVFGLYQKGPLMARVHIRSIET